MSEAVNVKPERPVYRNIGIVNIAFKYRLPIAGRASILHRVSGLLLVLALPFLLYLFEKSLGSEISFEVFRRALSSVIVKLILVVLAWGYAHHFFMGIRHLLMDIHMGLDKGTSAKTAWVCVVGGALGGLFVAAKLFGVF